MEYSQQTLADLHTAAFRRAMADSPVKITGDTWRLLCDDTGTYLITPISYQTDEGWSPAEIRTPLYKEIGK
jgi:hypothetical protein